MENSSQSPSQQQSSPQQNQPQKILSSLDNKLYKIHEDGWYRLIQYQIDDKQGSIEKTKIMSWNILNLKQSWQFVQKYLRSLKPEAQPDIIFLQEIKLESQEEYDKIQSLSRPTQQLAQDQIAELTNQFIKQLKIDICVCQSPKKCFICQAQDEQLNKEIAHNFGEAIKTAFNNTADIFSSEHYYNFINYSSKYEHRKTNCPEYQSGVVIYIKKGYPLPQKVRFGLGVFPCNKHTQAIHLQQQRTECTDCTERDSLVNKEGRVIILDYDAFVLIGAYFPNPGKINKNTGKQENDYWREIWDEVFIKCIDELKKNKKILIFGDLNASLKNYPNDPQVMRMEESLLKQRKAKFFPDPKDQQFTLCGSQSYGANPYNQLDYFVTLESEQGANFETINSCIMTLTENEREDRKQSFKEHLLWAYGQPNKQQVPDHLPIFFSFDNHSPKQASTQEAQEQKKQMDVQQLQNEKKDHKPQQQQQVQPNNPGNSQPNQSEKIEDDLEANFKSQLDLNKSDKYNPSKNNP